MIWGYFTYILIIDLVNDGFTPTTLGLILVAVVPLTYFAVLLSLKPVARTSRSLLLLTGLNIAGLVTIASEFFNGKVSATYLIISIISLTMWLLYVYWYSSMPKSRIVIEVGGQMPELEFNNHVNERVLTSNFADKKILYLFYRGNWCPLCMAQIEEVAAQYQELEKRGVEVLLISPQRVSKSAALAKKMKVNFHFLTDEDNKMARRLKINHDHSLPLGLEILGYDSNTVLPTVIITNEKGEIIFLDQTDNYRIRPEPETFLKAIDVA